MELDRVDIQMRHVDVAGLEVERCFDMGIRAGQDDGFDLVIKLTWNYSLDFWDFTASVAPFCINWAGVLALRAMVTHYLLRAGARLGAKAL